MLHDVLKYCSTQNFKQLSGLAAHPAEVAAEPAAVSSLTTLRVQTAKGLTPPMTTPAGKRLRHSPPRHQCQLSEVRQGWPGLQAEFDWTAYRRMIIAPQIQTSTDLETNRGKYW